MARDLSRQADDRLGAPDEAAALFVHEFRNPLAVIKGYTTVLDGAPSTPNPEVLRTSISAIRRAVETLESLLGSFDEAGPLFGGRIDLSLEDVLISTLVEETVSDLRSVADGRGLHVFIEDDAVVRAEPVRLRQVLTNLISNAIKFGPPRSDIEVVVGRNEGSIRICVVDQGSGVPEGKADDLFQKFSRLDDTKDGSGLGLYISRSIAMAHGGDLKLEDTDDGCRFSLTLPIHEGRGS